MQFSMRQPRETLGAFVFKLPTMVGNWAIPLGFSYRIVQGVLKG